MEQERLTMTPDEWKRTHRDFKTIDKGQRYVLRMVDGKGTCLVPVDIIKPLTLAQQVKALNGTRGRGAYFVRVKHDREWNEVQVRLTDGHDTRATAHIDIGHTKESRQAAVDELTATVKHFIEA